MPTGEKKKKEEEEKSKGLYAHKTLQTHLRAYQT